MTQPPNGTVDLTRYLAAGLAQREICAKQVLSARGGQARRLIWLDQSSSVLAWILAILHSLVTDNGTSNVECVTTVDQPDIRGLATA